MEQSGWVCWRVAQGLGSGACSQPGEEGRVRGLLGSLSQPGDSASSGLGEVHKFPLRTLSPLLPSHHSFFFLNLFILFIYFWLCWVFVAAHGLSLVAVSGGYSSLRCAGFSLQWLLLLQSMGSRCVDFSSCGTRAQ